VGSEWDMMAETEERGAKMWLTKRDDRDFWKPGDQKRFTHEMMV
jgi:hypothetical protein